MASPAKAGYAKFAKKAASGQALMVFTVGPGGGVGSGATLGPGGVDFSTAVDCVMASVAGAGTLRKVPVAEGLPEGDEGYVLNRGGLTVILWKRFIHQDHINKYGVAVMQAYLAPYLATGGSRGLGKVLLGLAALAGGWLAADYL